MEARVVGHLPKVLCMSLACYGKRTVFHDFEAATAVGRGAIAVSRAERRTRRKLGRPRRSAPARPARMTPAVPPARSQAALAPFELATWCAGHDWMLRVAAGGKDLLFSGNRSTRSDCRYLHITL